MFRLKRIRNNAVYYTVIAAIVTVAVGCQNASQSFDLERNEKVIVKDEVCSDCVEDMFVIFDPVQWALESTLFPNGRSRNGPANVISPEEEQRVIHIQGWLSFFEGLANGICF